MKFTMSIDKKKAGDLARAKGHNLRTHHTKSQLPAAAWFIPDRPHHTVIPWDDAKAEHARSLAKRKDAVVGIEIVIQVGNQTDWRHPPTKEHPHGKPKQPRPVNLNHLAAATRKWLETEFGRDNIVSLECHLDESTPHFQAVVTPIHGDKLNAKHWVGGIARCGSLRHRAWQQVNALVPCDYTPGGPGGKPHDPGKRAGETPPMPGLLDLPGKYRQLERENRDLRARVAKLEQVQFSREKRRHQASQLDKAEQVLADAQQDRQKAAGALQEAENERGDIQGVRHALEAAKTALSGKVEKLQQDASYYEQVATELLAKNEQLADELAAERERTGQLAKRLDEYEQPVPQPRRPGQGSSYEP